jgi:uncharacterized RDD family membrane protein YckC
MTEQPPPPPGNYPPPPGGGYPPPPPPQGGGYPPPPPPQGGGYPPPPPPEGGAYPPPPSGGALPTEAYTPWLTRVLAFLIDYVPILIVGVIDFIISMATAGSCVAQQSDYSYSTVCTGPSVFGLVAQFVLGLVILVYVLWNYGYRQGTTGSSIGKSLMKFKVIGENTGQPIGFGLSVVRQIAHFVDAIICYVGYLFPLWDAKRQTLADKIMTTVCVPL